MAYKPRRQKRYESLRDAGFVKFEARSLSFLPFKLPYMQPMIRQRNAEYVKAIRQAKRRGLSESEFSKWWTTHIKRRYIAMGWKRRGDWWGATVTFRMLKAVERGYKDKHPSYESPWEKRQKQWRSFLDKFEREYEKYPAGRAYPRKGQI